MYCVILTKSLINCVGVTQLIISDSCDSCDTSDSCDDSDSCDTNEIGYDVLLVVLLPRT